MTNKIKKYTIISSMLALFLGCFCFGQLKYWHYGEMEQNFPWDTPDTEELNCNGNTDLGNCTSIKEDERGNGTTDTILRRLLKVFGLNPDKQNDLKFKDYLLAILNMLLGLVAFIALIMTIYTFYMMLFSDNEAGIKKAKSNLLGIFIALAIIGLAWLIVSFIFWRYQEYWKSNEDVIKSGNIAMIGDCIDNNQIYLTI